MIQEQIFEMFTKKYDQDKWKEFLSSLFIGTKLLKNPETLIGIDINIAIEVLKLGYIVLNENSVERNIAVYEVTLAKGIILERNRVGLRNLLRRYWKNLDGAFIVYHNSDNKNWRFSYVSELTGFDSEGDYAEIKTEPKRYTYLFGEGESVRTAVERFAILAKKGSSATLDDVKDAFSVEKLSKTFFEEYKKHYDLFCKYMVKYQKYQKKFNGDEKAIRDFVKKLLGRIVFLYFIQKKGWLGVAIDKKWGDGDLNYLSNLFNNFRKKNSSSQFYKDILSKLFFDSLNTKREDDLIELIEGNIYRIPYLNGGLFEEENKEYREILFDDELFKNLFDFFNQYNFTIYEDDPIDQTIAVDPEMLGHIFENLLEDNKDKGAFYTPKEIVHYMCQESLIEYLGTWFENKGYEVYTDFDKKDQTTFLSPNEGRKGQLVFETDKTHHKKINRLLIEKLLKKKFDENDEKLIIKHSNEFHNALDSIKICDQAIGSGAFPMGLLQEIFTVKQTLYYFENSNLTKFPATQIKLNIIQKSIYGVDIEKGAVDIARLRFWLSLVIEEDEPKPLPNLDYKIVVGNSLVSKLDDEIIDIDWNIKQSNLTEANIYVQNMKKALNELIEKEKNYFEAFEKNKLKKEIRNLKIDILINQLSINKKEFASKNVIQKDMVDDEKINKKHFQIEFQIQLFNNSINKLKKLKDNPDLPLNFFDWKLDFPEVMNEQIAEKVGFDIVIGNPPYIGQKGNNKIFKPVKESLLGKLFHQRRMDYFYFFIHKGLDLLTSNGVLCQITTNYYFTATYADKLRADIKNRSSILKIINFNELKLFESALGQHNSIILLRKPFNKDTIVETIAVTKANNFDLGILRDVLNCTFPDAIYSKKDNSKIYDPQNGNILIDLSTSSNNELFENIFYNCDHLSKHFELVEGIHTGADTLSDSHIKKYKIQFSKGIGIFVLTKDEVSALNLNNEEKQLIKPWFKNSDISKWTIAKSTGKNLIYYTTKGKYKNVENIRKHLSKFKIILINRKVRSGTGIISESDYEDFITGKKYISYVMNASAFKSGNYHFISYPREASVFEGDKIVCPQRSLENTFAFSNGSFYGSADIYFIKEKTYTLKLKYLLALLNSNLFYYWLYNRGKRKGEMLELYIRPLSELPIKKILQIEQTIFIRIVDYIITEKGTTQESKIFAFFEFLINCMVYELYLPEEIKAADAEVLKHLIDLPELKDDWSDEQKIKTIEKVYQELSDPKHPLAIAMERQKTVKEVRIIEGLPELGGA